MILRTSFSALEKLLATISTVFVSFNSGTEFAPAVLVTGTSGNSTSFDLRLLETKPLKRTSESRPFFSQPFSMIRSVELFLADMILRKWLDEELNASKDIFDS